MSRARFRKEHDSLGTVSVPSDALYGAQTARAIRNFPISGRTVPPALIRAYLLLKEAAARTNFKCGVLAKEDCEKIVKAVHEVLKLSEDKWPSLFPVDPYQQGAGTNTHMNVNEVVANVANRLARKKLGSYRPIHPNDHVNRSQSTNDTFPTAMRIAILVQARPLREELALLSRSLKKKAHAWRDIPKSARTHLQDAVPMTLGQEVGGYAATAARAAKWIDAGRDALREIGIGGSAAGTGLTVPHGYRRGMIVALSRSTGEKLSAAPDLFEAMQSQSPVSYYSSMLRLTALELTRICNDLRLLSSGPMTGLAEVFLPAVQPGSSIMPGKVNPSVLEMVNQCCYSVIGYDQSVVQCELAGQLELNVMMPMMAYSTLEATGVLTNALRCLRISCVDGMRPNSARLRQYFESTPQIATALSPKLGYEKTAKLVQKALKTRKSVVQLAREEKLLREDELEKLIDPEKLVRP